jgi:curli biogenesis system outer membrane secretion channel CsgG
MRNQVFFFLLAASTAAGGCGGALSRSLGGSEYVKPTIAVMKFENRSNLAMGWNIGDGMKDILVDRLFATDKFEVVERPEIGSIMKELQFQQTGATREHNRAKLGQIKNVQYLVKGTVTDFGHVSTNSGFFGWADSLDIFGSGSMAVMGMTLYVVDVESGEIVCSESIEESVRAKDLNVKAAYKDVGFGGSTFYRTPLGRATAKVIDKAVRRVASSIASRPWQPKIAQITNDTTVMLNGGRDRKVSVGDEYEVLQLGDPIVDPDTGDVIGVPAGTVIGRVRIQQVHTRYSVALVVSGSASKMKVGQRCAQAKEQPPVAETGQHVRQSMNVDKGGDFLGRLGIFR